MSLIFTAKKANSRTPVKSHQKYEVIAQAGEEYNLIDSLTGKTPVDIKATRKGDDLILRSDSEDVEVVIKDFWKECTQENQCYAVLDVPATPDAAEGVVTITQSEHELAGLISGEVGTLPEDRFSSPLVWWVLGGLGVIGIAAAAGGGGGGSGSGVLDTDRDGLPDDVEKRDPGTGGKKLDPSNPDTNGDGRLDGDEDSDGDGTPNKNDSTPFGEDDPNAAFPDMDKDGIRDDVDPDIDGDGVNNADEKLVGTDPRNPETKPGINDGELDTDNDGLSNAEESDPTLNTPTDRNKDGKPDITDGNTDADKDGMSNQDEKNNGTNPLKPDTDGDGTPDKEDTENAFDKDKDGVNDADENAAGSGSGGEPGDTVDW